jgi:hypothetical protein
MIVEWMKLRGSAALWLVSLSACFVPTIILVARLVRPLPQQSSESFWKNAWEANAILLLPMVVMLLTSLVVQIETRNNTWKQVHASPQRFVFAAKLSIILTLVAGFFLIANAAVFATALLTGRGATPLFGARSFRLFVDVLPIVALQYLLSLHVKNFMIPLGIGVAVWLAAIGGLSWKYIYVIPYVYPAMDFLQMAGARPFSVNLHACAAAYSIAFCLAGAILYARKEDRG